MLTGMFSRAYPGSRASVSFLGTYSASVRVAQTSPDVVKPVNIFSMAQISIVAASCSQAADPAKQSFLLCLPAFSLNNSRVKMLRAFTNSLLKLKSSALQTPPTTGQVAAVAKQLTDSDKPKGNEPATCPGRQLELKSLTSPPVLRIVTNRVSRTCPSSSYAVRI